jgi:DNA adenine methylase
MNTRPLLKWAGGKRQLLPALRAHYPASFGTYIEPFVGSGAVFFDLYASGRLAGRNAVLIDANADLIGCYEQVRDAADAVADALDELAARHAIEGSTHYYRVRDERFNPGREAGRDREGRVRYTPELAAMFIYLNRTGFNGLFRVNARGGFNVPAGRYVRPAMATRASLRYAADALRSGVQLVWGSFERAEAVARAGDFLYLDPPYAPVSRTANFTSYTAGRFTLADQRRLRQMIVRLARRGCHVLCSNSTAGEVEALYEHPTARTAGLRTCRVLARRAINSNPSRRGVVEEYLVTNVDPRCP